MSKPINGHTTKVKWSLSQHPSTMRSFSARTEALEAPLPSTLAISTVWSYTGFFLWLHEYINHVMSRRKHFTVAHLPALIFFPPPILHRSLSLVKCVWGWYRCLPTAEEHSHLSSALYTIMNLCIKLYPLQKRSFSNNWMVFSLSEWR